MKYINMFAFTAICLTFLSCDKDNPDTTAADNQLLPLKVGNTWRYISKDFNEAGAVTATYDDGLIVTGTVVKNGKTYYIIADVSDITDTAFIIRSDEKIVNVYSDDLQGDLIFYKWPANNGEVLFSISGGGYTEEHVASTKPVTVNTFNGYRVLSNVYYNNQPYKKGEIYFKPNLGIIGSIDSAVKNFGGALYKSNEMQLVSYDLK